MRILMGILVFLLVVLQYRLWVGEGSLAEVHNLRRDIENQKEKITRLRERNLELRAEVENLKHGQEAIEERARSGLGMIRDNEIFYQVIEPEKTTGE